MQRSSAVALAIGFGALLLWLAIGQAWVTDDALISFRYLDNLFAGHGLVYNPGERVEGFSNPVFLLALAPFRALHVDLFAAAIGLGIASTMIELALLAWLAWRTTGSALAVGVSVGLFASDRVVRVWASGGLETAMHGALVFSAFALAVVHRDAPERRVLTTTALLVVVAASRPEGALYYPLYLVWLLVAARQRREARGALVRSLNLFVPAVALLLAARFVYYGELTANPFRAKMTGVPTLGFGLGYLRAFAERMGWSGLWSVPWLGLVGALWWARRRERNGWVPLVIALACVLAQLAAGVAMGGDYLCDFRFYRPLLGPLYFAVGWSVWRVARVPGGRAPALAIAVVLCATQVVLQRRGNAMFADAPPAAEHKRILAVTRQQSERFRAALLAFADPGDAQIADKSGVMGLGHDLRTVDCTGLLSRDVARDFYLRDEFAETGARERLPGHARWPRVDFMQREKFTFIFAKVNRLSPDVPEIKPGMPRRTREYPFLHVTIPLDGGEFFRFFTTLDEEQVLARARRKHLGVCVRRPWAQVRCVPPG